MSETTERTGGVPEDASENPAFERLLDTVAAKTRANPPLEPPGPGDEEVYVDESDKLFIGREFTLEQFARWYKVQRLGARPFNAIGYHHTEIPRPHQWVGLPSMLAIFKYYNDPPEAPGVPPPHGLGWQPYGVGPQFWLYSGENQHSPGVPRVCVGTHPAYDGYGIVGRNERWAHIEHVFNGDDLPFTDVMKRASGRLLAIICSPHPHANRTIPLRFIRDTGVDNPTEPIGIMYHRDQTFNWQPGMPPKSCPGLKVTHDNLDPDLLRFAAERFPWQWNGAPTGEIVDEAGSLVAGLGAMVRGRPNRDGEGQFLTEGKTYATSGYTDTGEAALNSSRWYRLADGSGWVHSSGGTYAATEGRGGRESPGDRSGPFTEHAEVVGVSPRITRERFAEILRGKGSPAAAEAEAAWAAVAGHGVDPLFALAIFHKESSYGLDGVTAQHATHSPGNTRSSRTGAGTVIQVQQGGVPRDFVRYDTWEDGWSDLAFRLVDPDFDYAKRNLRTVRTIIETWAPRGDGNDPDDYVGVVVEDMNAWAGSAPPPPPPTFEAPQPVEGPVQDRVINDREFVAVGRTVTAIRDGVPCHLFADPTSALTREPLRKGEEVEVRYVAVGEDRRLWFVAAEGWRMPASGFVAPE